MGKQSAAHRLDGVKLADLSLLRQHKEQHCRHRQSNTHKANDLDALIDPRLPCADLLLQCQCPSLFLSPSAVMVNKHAAISRCLCLQSECLCLPLFQDEGKREIRVL